MVEKQIVEQFLKHKDDSRLEVLIKIMKSHNLNYEIRSCDISCHNVFVKLTDAVPYTLLVAHYDVFGNSTGINDNTAAVAMLIEIIKHFNETSGPHKNFNVLFTDKEESGMIGSHYFSKINNADITEALVFDIIGYGDTMVYGSYQNFDALKQYGIKEINEVLPSDNIQFSNANIKTVLITAAHNKDLTLMAQDKYRLSTKPKFYESFHNRPEDNKIEVINFELIEKLRKKVIKYLK